MRATIALVAVAVGVSLLAGAAPAGAHHAFAATFDTSKPIVVHGVISKVELINPHSWFWLDVKNPDGSMTSWMVEGGSPNALLRRGFNKNSLLPGTEIYVEAFQAKDGTNRANGQSLTLADGKKLFLGSSGENAPDAGK